MRAFVIALCVALLAATAMGQSFVLDPSLDIYDDDRSHTFFSLMTPQYAYYINTTETTIPNHRAALLARYNKGKLSFKGIITLPSTVNDTIWTLHGPVICYNPNTGLGMNRELPECTNNTAPVVVELGKLKPGYSVLTGEVSLDAKTANMLFRSNLYVQATMDDYPDGGVRNYLDPIQYYGRAGFQNNVAGTGGRHAFFVLDFEGNDNKKYPRSDETFPPSDMTNNTAIGFISVTKGVGETDATMHIRVAHSLETPGTLRLDCGSASQTFGNVNTENFLIVNNNIDIKANVYNRLINPANKCYFFLNSGEFPTGELFAYPYMPYSWAASVALPDGLSFTAILDWSSASKYFTAKFLHNATVDSIDTIDLVALDKKGVAESGASVCSFYDYEKHGTDTQGLYITRHCRFDVAFIKHLEDGRIGLRVAMAGTGGPVFTKALEPYGPVHKKSGLSKAAKIAIGVGVGVGVLAIAGIIGAVYYFKGRNGGKI